MPRADLEAAAAAGLITAEQVAPLDAFLEQRETAPSALNEEEPLRFIRNFHDVFLAIGIGLLTIGLWIAALIFAGEGALSFQSRYGDGPIWRAMMALIASSAILWVLAEVFSRKRRLFLPSIALCLSLASFAAAFTATVYGLFVFRQFTDAVDTGRDIPGFAMARGLAPAAGLGALAASIAFYARFRLPFSLGFAGTSLVFLLGAILFAFEPTILWRLLSPLLLLMGCGLFLAGVAFDVRDPHRATRFSDNGFWLHMAAAPMILNGALGCVTNVVAPGEAAWGMLADGPAGPTIAAATLLIVTFLAFVSLLINRRALIVSALLTTGVAVGVLMKSAGLEAGGLAASTLLTLGAGVLVLGAGWHKARAGLLSALSPSGVWARVFPPEVLE